jgi:1-acyl-sn-glycerol-3-phosphate acyltransferase
MLRTLFAVIFLSLYTILLGPWMLLYTLASGRVDPLYWFGLGGVLFVVRLVGARIRSRGTENIPQGVCIFMANHTSNADAPAVVGAIPRRVAILVKDSLLRIPVVGQAFRLAHFVPVNRANREAAIASVDRAVEYIKEGTSFLVYPEGTRSPDGRLQRFKKGAFVMAIKSGAPIVPVACAGAHRVIRKREWRIRPGEISVTFLPALDPSQYTIEQRDQLAQRVHDAIAAALPPDQQPAGADGLDA